MEAVIEIKRKYNRPYQITSYFSMRYHWFFTERFPQKKSGEGVPLYFLRKQSLEVFWGKDVFLKIGALKATRSILQSNPWKIPMRKFIFSKIAGFKLQNEHRYFSRILTANLKTPISIFGRISLKLPKSL